MPKIHWFTAWLIFASLTLFLASLAFIGGVLHFVAGYVIT